MSEILDRKLTGNNQKYLTDEPIPLIIVEGFLGAAGAVLWGSFEDHMNSDHQRRRRVIFANVGPVSSLHDRACELFYAIKGGTVDYGEEHSQQNSHLRHGRTNSKGLYPEWSQERPLHFLGHSMGGPTIIKLQWLLSIGFFGARVHPDMVLSVNSISAPFRGTQLVYTLGEREDAAPAVRPMSVGSLITKGVHLVSFLSPFLPRSLDLHTESRSLSYHQSSFYSLARQLWKSDWAESRDAAPFDVTFEAVEEREATLEGVINPSTYYRNHVANMTQKAGADTNTQVPPISNMISPPIYLCSRTMGSFDYSVLRPIPWFLADSTTASDGTESKHRDVEHGDLHSPPTEVLGEEYWANDGVVPVFSQWHPLECRSTTCKHYSTLSSTPSETAVDNTSDKLSPEPGVWHVHQVENANHLSLAPLWLGTAGQKMFWRELGEWLRSIDSLRSI